MQGHDPLQPAVREAAEQLGRLGIAQMTEARPDPRLHGRRITPRLEHAGIVIELERERIATRERLANDGRRMSRVAQHAESPARGAKYELAGLARIVRHREWQDGNRADGKLAIVPHA